MQTEHEYICLYMYIACLSVHVRDTKLNHLAPADNAGNVSPNELGHVPNNILIARHISKGGVSLQFDLSYSIFTLIYISDTLAAA